MATIKTTTNSFTTDEPGDLTKKYQTWFLGTAIYNWFVAVSMLKPTDAFVAMNISPIPSEDYMLHLCCLFIGSFGFVYYWASRDLYANYDLVWMGMTMKTANIVLAIVDIWLGTITWQYLLLLVPDMILIVVFHRILHEVKEQQLLGNNKK